MNRYLYEFQCPCGTNSYIALVAEGEESQLFERACWLAEKHVREEGNTFDPTKLKLIEVRNFE